MGHETLITKGKRLSFLLRHDTDYKFDKNGWREVEDLIKNHNYTFDEIVTKTVSRKPTALVVG